MKAMGLRCCDRHKGDRIRKSGVTAHKSQQDIRKQKNAKDYDKEHALGALPQRPWSANFEHLAGVIRAHPHPGVAKLFLQIKARKSKAMGLLDMLNADENNHDPSCARAGVFGQSSFVLKVSSALSTAVAKSGMSFTANCLEAGPNKAAKTALAMQSSLSMILGKLKAARRKSTRDCMTIHFSVRQDFVGQNPRNSSHKNQQVGEECTGNFFGGFGKTAKLRQDTLHG
jgi:hypothetical protein